MSCLVTRPQSASAASTLPLPTVRPRPSRQARRRARAQRPTSRASLIAIHLMFTASGLIAVLTLFLRYQTHFSWAWLAGSWHP